LRIFNAGFTHEIFPRDADKPKGPDDPLDWLPTKTDYDKAERLSNNSKPGPDKLRYLAWRRFPLTTTLIREVGLALSSPP
jgi:hypothetical protein